MNEVIDIKLSSPNLTTSNMGDSGTIKLNNLPSIDTTQKKKCEFRPRYRNVNE